LNYSLYPGTSVIERVRTHSIPVFEKRSERLFTEKWPGLITAFDELLKARSVVELTERIKGFYEIANSQTLNGPRLTSAVAKWGTDHRISDDNLDRLALLAVQIRQKHMPFRSENVKRTLDGGMPNSVRWYPPKNKTVYVYYEIGLEIPRNQNEGRFIGWGSMQQWREPSSHLIRPKLIYTTASKPNYGLKAFVVDDEWYVKLHGGTSQQYHYTGLHKPSTASRMDERPNNLTESGLALLDIIEAANLPQEALHFYIAGLYNSEVAAEFMDQAGSGSPFKIRIPGAKDLETVRELCVLSRRMRDLFWLQHISEDRGTVDAFELAHFSEKLLTSVGFERQQVGSRKFKAHEVYAVPTNIAGLIEQFAQPIQSEIDELAAALYGD
jgi:hypothetical protein